jgi:ribonuclease HI
VKYNLYCDGSSGARRGRAGGYGWIVLEEDTWQILAHGCGGEPDTTNNRMELSGAIEGLRFFADAAASLGDVDFAGSITVISDSQYALGIMSGKFSMSSNIDLGHRARELYARLGADRRWQRGHGSQGVAALASLSVDVLCNECCDRLAKAGRVRATQAPFTLRQVGLPPSDLVPARDHPLFEQLRRRCDS